MTVLGVSGHQRLPQEVYAYADQELRTLMTSQPEPLIGWSSLAEGADQLFAATLLETGGTLRVVVPCQGYESTLDGPSLEIYRHLLASAETIETLDFAEPGERAYDAAGRYVVEQCELLVAIWDGRPARGLGGTADAVAHARRLHRSVAVIWPNGATRA